MTEDTKQTKCVLHPLDFDALRKGTWIEGGELESAAQCKPGDGGWQFALMGLCKEICAHTSILARIDHDRIRLMTDAEADEWNARQGKRAINSLHRATARTALIDHRELTDEQRAKADHRSRYLSFVSQATRAAQAKASRWARLRGGTNALPPSDAPDTDDGVARAH